MGSAGLDASEFAASHGLVLDEWQSWCLDGLLSEDVDYRLIATLAVLIVPRQNGKNSVLEAYELYCFYVLDVPFILHSAHLQETSATHMERMRSLIEGSPSLAEITSFHLANGKERILRTDTRAQIKFVTRSKKTGRGGSPRIIVFDEALYLSDEALQAMVPSLSAQSMNDDQPIMVFASSAPVAESAVLHRLRDACAAGEMPKAFYAEWSSEPGADITDRDEWYRSNPGLGIRISEAWIADTESPPMLTPEAFAVERLGIVQGADAAPSVLPEWNLCASPESVIVNVDGIAVDVAQDGSYTSIAVAGREADGTAAVELIDHLPGTAQAVIVLQKLVAEFGPVLIDPRSESARLIQPLTDAGVRFVEVEPLAYLKSCAALKDAVTNGNVRHRGQPVLTASVQQAVVKAQGEAWKWDRRSSQVDISPLVAVTLAYGVHSAVQPAGFAMVFGGK